MEYLGIDISNLIINNADSMEKIVEFIFVSYIGGNVLPSNFVDKITKHFPLSDIIQNYFKKDKKDE
jgi:hypothetical protein